MRDLTGLQTLEIMRQAQYYNKWLYSLIRPWLWGQVLEAGAGIGNFLKFFLDDGLSITALDVNLNYLRQIKLSYPDISLIQFDLQHPSLPTQYHDKFDTIVTLNVLEHIPNISQALGNLFHLLKPGGKIIIVVPAFNQAYTNLDRQLGHVKRYHYPQLSSLLDQSGFKIIDHRYLNVLGLVGWITVGRLFGRSQISSTHLKVFDFLSRVVLWVEKYIRFPVGLSILCIAQKP